MTGTTALTRAEATALVHVLADSVAKRAGIRALLVKGPFASKMGLRPERISSDADILVDPGRFDDYIQALGALGWTPRPETGFPSLMAPHSRALIHPEWPVDIDAHHTWPGFLIDPQVAFEHLWTSRVEVTLAGVPLTTTNRPHTALIVGLHSLREREALLEADYRRRDERVLADALRADPALLDAVRAEAEALGAVQTVWPLLEAVGAGPAPEAADSEPLRRWRARTVARHPLTAWLYELRDASWSRRAVIVWRGLFPRAEQLRALDPSAATSADLARVWWARLARGVKTLGEAYRDLVRGR
ncbi:hypothetical protein SCMU_28940 [Sinomonas cyclohexanicum]|uniref:Nucleotidyltransferase family protein n=1 Tax=Sinomonas cyclohexanicum TaxID=322009 RepID=A0ABM7PY32_SINCY|nr:nucleotidyltransferase family protein [Corynebacterium cyclohexanicum]BCT77052.1 hypothetical protein SCMU_28940 [Corynebacterium cyclohexanicum]